MGGASYNFFGPHFSEHETSGKNARNSWDPLEGQTPIFVASLKQYTGLVTGRQFLRMLKACYLRDAPRGSKICSLHVPLQFGFGLVSEERQEMIWSYMAPLLRGRNPPFQDDGLDSVLAPAALAPPAR